MKKLKSGDMNEGSVSAAEAAWRKAEICPHCGVRVLRTRLLKHFRRTHPDLQVTGQKQLSLVRCKACGVLVREDRVGRHERKVHGSSHLKPLGPTTGEENQSRFIGPVERCEHCHARVVFKEIQSGVRKAYEVDSRGRILWTHACDGDSKSESLRTMLGGAVESSRRRH